MALGKGELDTVIGENGMDITGHGANDGVALINLQWRLELNCNGGNWDERDIAENQRVGRFALKTAVRVLREMDTRKNLDSVRHDCMSFALCTDIAEAL